MRKGVGEKGCGLLGLEAARFQHENVLSQSFCASCVVAGIFWRGLLQPCSTEPHLSTERLDGLSVLNLGGQLVAKQAQRHPSLEVALALSENQRLQPWILPLKIGITAAPSGDGKGFPQIFFRLRMDAYAQEKNFCTRGLPCLQFS